MSWSNIANPTDPARRWTVVVFVVVMVGWAMMVPPASAGTTASNPECDDCYRIDAVVIEGLLRTHRGVIERELLFEEGDWASEDDVERSVQRLRNTNIFRRVDYELSDHAIGTYGGGGGGRGEDRGRLLRISVDELYTISPSFRFGQGGDTMHLRLGASDINLGGRFLQGGVTYSRLGDANSFSLWFRDPRFLDARQSVTARVGIGNRIFTLFDSGGDIEGGYLRTRYHGALEYSRDWQRWFRTGAGVSFASNHFSYSMVNEPRQDGQEERGGLYATSQTLGLELSGRLGKIDHYEHLREGTTLGVTATQNFHFGDRSPRSRRLSTTLHHYTLLPLDITVANRTSLGFRSSDIPTYEKFFGGGLDIIRGTFDDRHRGIHNWYSNVELRVPTFRNRWLIVENTAFFDAISVGEQPGDLLGVTAATTGLGLRLISRDFHGMIIRLDYAPPIMGADGPAISFGAGQFF